MNADIDQFLVDLRASDSRGIANLIDDTLVMIDRVADREVPAAEMYEAAIWIVQQKRPEVVKVYGLGKLFQLYPDPVSINVRRVTGW